MVILIDKDKQAVETGLITIFFDSYNRSDDGCYNFYVGTERKRRIATIQPNEYIRVIGSTGGV